MGLGDFLKRRRERESPDPAVESVAQKLQGDGEPIGQMLPQAATSQVNLGGADLGTIFSMVGQAMKTGSIQMTQGDAQVIDMSGTDLGDQIRSVMGQYGIDVDDQDPTKQPNLTIQDGLAMQKQMLEALGNAGVDVNQLGGTASGTEGPTDAAEPGTEPA